MSFHVDPATRVVSETNYEKLIEIKHKRIVKKRFDVMQAQIDELRKEIEALKGHREN